MQGCLAASASLSTCGSTCVCAPPRLPSLTLLHGVKHPQLNDLAELARQAPATTFVCNHAAMPIRVGSRDAAAVFDEWKTGMAVLGACPNVVVKFGGLCMRVSGFVGADAPRRSADLAVELKPWFDVCVACFPGRVMFESNWPMDKGGVAYTAWWNTCARLAAPLTLAERNSLFFACANATYELELSARADAEFAYDI